MKEHAAIIVPPAVSCLQICCPCAGRSATLLIGHGHKGASASVWTPLPEQLPDDHAPAPWTCAPASWQGRLDGWHSFHLGPPSALGRSCHSGPATVVQAHPRSIAASKRTRKQKQTRRTSFLSVSCLWSRHVGQAACTRPLLSSGWERREELRADAQRRTGDEIPLTPN